MTTYREAAGTIADTAVTDSAQGQLFATVLPDPAEALASVLLDDADEPDDEVPLEQPFLPGLLRFCTRCGEAEGSRFATAACIFEEPDTFAA